jgi:hypothetical protein
VTIATRRAVRTSFAVERSSGEVGAVGSSGTVFDSR